MQHRDTHKEEAPYFRFRPPEAEQRQDNRR